MRHAIPEIPAGRVSGYAFQAIVNVAVSTDSWQTPYRGSDSWRPILEHEQFEGKTPDDSSAKKERHCAIEDSPEIGDVWTFCAIDSDTKIVLSVKVGKRDAATAHYP